MAATPNDIYTALALTIRDRVHKQGVRTMEARSEQEARVVAYLSAEFLPGPHLANILLNLGITEATREALSEFGLDLDQVITSLANLSKPLRTVGRLRSRISGYALATPGKSSGRKSTMK